MSLRAEVTGLLNASNGGDPGAKSRLIPLVYNELRRLAGHYMRQERPGHTLQATALVHEAYMRLIRQREQTWENKAHFFAIAGRLMREILIDHARAHRRGKRGGAWERVSWSEDIGRGGGEDPEQLIEIDTALKKLEEENPRQSQIVELKFFAGLTVDEIAAALKVSPKTVKRDWNVARAWLHRQIHADKHQ